MNNAEVKKMLLESLHDLKARRAFLSQDDIAADIINIICKYILSNETVQCGPNAMYYFPSNYMNYKDIVEGFVSSIKSEYSLSQSNIESLAQNVCLNLGWDGMPGFLDDYFSKNHGIVGNSNLEHFEYISSFHKRFEYGALTEQSEVDRLISLSFRENKTKMAVTITPSLTRKEARLVKRNGDVLIYEGTDPDYLFEIHFDSFDEVNFFALDLKPRHLRLEYYE